MACLCIIKIIDFTLKYFHIKGFFTEKGLPSEALL